MSAKAAPKTLHQVRNVAYIFAAWAGLQKGFAEKSANDKLWVEHQRNLRQLNAERQHAASEVGHGAPSGLAVPAELQELVKSFEK
ncbi:hypothetical protein LSM04_006507 [Trypanosoma melophagium]|uniref:uncharacterized protein n=1 Tax=Trypanosoma melophagium TaxID=715481 RepID=UPI00351A8C08|nr:hypothetical protein LSM04_006507 [Trypanosoma melophagium]